MLFPKIFGFAALLTLAKAVDLTGYEYVVVGSGAGGGPLAARLALAGHKTLLIEAGDDQGANVNYTIPAFNAKSSEDPNLSWNFFVKHYADEKRQARDYKTTYTTPDGSLYTGLNPPAGSVMKGTLYPRTGTLGGCTAHNALIAVYPHRSDFDRIATLTGDNSWSASNMRKYFERLEDNHYLLLGGLLNGKGHGKDGWLGTDYAPIDIVTSDPQLLSVISGAAFALSNATNAIVNLGTLIAGDANADTQSRDKQPALYQIPISTTNGKRAGSREFVIAVRDAKNADGSKKYPLDVRLNCHVTKVTFDQKVTPPRATGVEFLDGQYLYKASPKSGGASGTPGSATASREVIVAGGTYNSPQLLKLSGVGPSDELKKFNIPLLPTSLVLVPTSRTTTRSTSKEKHPQTSLHSRAVPLALPHLTVAWTASKTLSSATAASTPPLVLALPCSTSPASLSVMSTTSSPSAAPSTSVDTSLATPTTPHPSTIGSPGPFSKLTPAITPEPSLFAPPTLSMYRTSPTTTSTLVSASTKRISPRSPRPSTSPVTPSSANSSPSRRSSLARTSTPPRRLHSTPRTLLGVTTPLQHAPLVLITTKWLFSTQNSRSVASLD
ncbi:hypothetical protein P3342_012987 [Pyrenophora teres f. teres]|nr:hypothetical protein P3342_012987 [Pyrenophora teres f. teres]